MLKERLEMERERQLKDQVE